MILVVLLIVLKLLFLFPPKYFYFLKLKYIEIVHHALPDQEDRLQSILDPPLSGPVFNRSPVRGFLTITPSSLCTHPSALALKRLRFCASQNQFFGHPEYRITVTLSSSLSPPPDLFLASESQWPSIWPLICSASRHRVY